MKRFLTAAIGLPFVLAITIWGPEWLFAALVAAVGVLALDEFVSLWPDTTASASMRPLVLLAIPVTASFRLGWGGVVITLSACLAVVIVTGLLIRGRGFLRSFRSWMAGIVYVAVLLGFLNLLPRSGVLVLLGIVWIGDVAAYYVGRSIGRHRLAPAISPNKTVEGAIAGGAASLLVGLVLMERLLDVPFGILGAATVLTTAVAAQLGDLGESWLKRRAGVKDSSSRLPGHGGVLDRIDSLLLGAPVFYLFL